MSQEKKPDGADASACVFCRIVSGEVSALKVFEDADTLAFLTRGPLHPGHTLVIPKAHYETVSDIPDDALAAVSRTFKRVAKAVQRATAAAGVNILQNNGRAAGQAVFHAHFHVVPRHAGDGYRHWERAHDVSAEESADAARRIADMLR